MKVKMRGDDSGKEVEVSDERAVELVNSGAAVAADPSAVVDVPSKLVSEAQARHDYAETEYATLQEKKQAMVEQADVDARRPQGSHAQLHEGALPTRAVVDEAHLKRVEVDEEELFRNKGPVEARPDSAGVRGIPDVLTESTAAPHGKAADKAGTADKSKAAPK
jgi:hypothetical protein